MPFAYYKKPRMCIATPEGRAAASTQQTKFSKFSD